MQLSNKHPAGLAVLFMTEVWERFGFYIAQGLLVLYMAARFHFSDSKCFEILGAFTALAYIAPVVGGYIADKILGFRVAVIWGGIILCLGYATLALANETTFYFALAVIVLGTGFFKPNVSSLVGTLYDATDPRRDSGFTIFYVGINLGIIFSTMLSGFVQNIFGWRAIFCLASIGMIIAMVTFIHGSKKLPANNNLFIPSASIFVRPVVRYISLTLLMLFTLMASTLLMADARLANNVFLAVGVALFAALFFIAIRQEKEQRNKSILLLLLTIISMFFWALYFQLFSSLTLFVERDVARQFLGINIPSVAFLSLISIFIVLFGPALTKLWTALKRQKRDLALPVKFAFGMLFAGTGFSVMVLGTYFPNAQGLVLPIWLLLGYFLVAMGELFLSPIGLSMVTQLAPARLVGVLMGVWFFSLGVGGQMAGIIAQWAVIPANITNIALQVTLYRHAFLIYAAMGIGMSLLIFLLYRISMLLSIRSHNPQGNNHF